MSLTSTDHFQTHVTMRMWPTSTLLASSSSTGIRYFYTDTLYTQHCTLKMAPLRVAWHREHFLSPLLQLAAKDNGETFTLVECPGGTGEMQVKLREGEIDLCIGTPQHEVC